MPQKPHDHTPHNIWPLQNHKAIQFHFLNCHMINRILHSWSFHMKSMKLAEGISYEMTTRARSSIYTYKIEIERALTLPKRNIRQREKGTKTHNVRWLQQLRNTITNKRLAKEDQHVLHNKPEKIWLASRALASMLYYTKQFWFYKCTTSCVDSKYRYC